jgi:predicted TIM-barrel fold metal-dependent hydrolase
MARIGMDGVIRQKDVEALCDIARHAKANVKISAFYALGKKQAPFNDLVPMVHALYRAYGPQRLMWGSDSPFQVQPPYTYTESLDFVLEGVPFLSPEDKQWMMRRTAENIFF